MANRNACLRQRFAKSVESAVIGARFAFIDVDHFNAGKCKALGIKSQLD
jgi:hypothetical protein